MPPVWPRPPRASPADHDERNDDGSPDQRAQPLRARPARARQHRLDRRSLRHRLSDADRRDPRHDRGGPRRRARRGADDGPIRRSGSRCRQRVPVSRRRCSIPATPGPTKRPTMPRRRSLPGCSPRTSSPLPIGSRPSWSPDRTGRDDDEADCRPHLRRRRAGDERRHPGDRPLRGRPRLGGLRRSSRLRGADRREIRADDRPLSRRHHPARGDGPR